MVLFNRAEPFISTSFVDLVLLLLGSSFGGGGGFPLPSGYCILEKEVAEGSLEINPILSGSREDASVQLSAMPEFDSDFLKMFAEGSLNDMALKSISIGSSVVARLEEQDKLYMGDGVRGKSSYKQVKRLKLIKPIGVEPVQRVVKC